MMVRDLPRLRIQDIKMDLAWRSVSHNEASATNIGVILRTFTVALKDGPCEGLVTSCEWNGCPDSRAGTNPGTQVLTYVQ